MGTGFNRRAASFAKGLQDFFRRGLSVMERRGHGTFRIRDAYNLLAAPSAIAFPKKSIWVDKVPTKVTLFAWEATWEKILTLDRLQKRG